MSTKYQAGTRVSEYILEDCLGAGTYGEVWRARHHVWPDEHVAVKLPTEPQYVRHLRHEGAVVHAVRHPNIIRVLGMDPYAEIPYLVMELVNGPSLKTVLAEHPRGLPPDVACVIMRGLLSALQAAHGAGVLHRDVKPGNVMLHLDGRRLEDVSVDQVRVGDFGLGMGDVDALRSMVQSGSLNRDDALVGTLAYMAPELRDGRAKAEPRCDLYSAGVVFFELLTGERPVGAELPSALRREVPAALDAVFRGLYARADRRYASAADVLADLGAPLRRLDAGAGARAAGGPPPLDRNLDPRVPPVRAARGSCRACNRPTYADDNYCIHCGAKIREPRRCSRCNGFPATDDRFCVLCGHDLSHSAVG